MGLLIFKNEDQECFKWCLKYHQSKQDKNASRICNLRKAEDKYKYEGIEYLTSYDDIRIFEETNKVCILVAAISDTDEIYLSLIHI